MKPRAVILGVLLVAIVGVAWRSQLWTVARPGDAPLPLRVDPDRPRAPVALDATLPAVPVGVEHLRGGQGVLLVHYWAPWERSGREQITLLDSLRQLPAMEGLRVAVVCLDPFPTVARFVARHRLRLSVLMDHRGDLRATLPCPSVPYTYVLDADGRLALAQAGEVDWLADRTRATLGALLEEPAAGTTPRPPGS